MAMVKTESLDQGIKGIDALPIAKQVGLMLGIAASVALGVVIVLWSREPNYGVLYASQSEKDLMAVVEELTRMNMKYKLDAGTGSISVPTDEVYRTRLLLARQGLPSSTENQGYELLDGKQAFGTSRMMESSRHNRAMEGELARTIATLQSVRSARVHIAQPKASVFVRQARKPSASVVLDLVSGNSLNADDIDGIIHLVASSVPELEIERVTVVDQRGRLLTRAEGDEEFSSSSDRLSYRQKVEQMYVSRIIDLLSPIVGDGGVRAQVSAEIDFSRKEEASENYSPQPDAIRSEQTHDQTRTGPDGSQGIPGALTNQPPPAGVTAEGADAAQSNAMISSSRDVTRNYEIDKTYSHSKKSPGEILKLSVAVVVNNKRAVDADGNPVSTAFTDEELQRLTALVQETVGFNTNRGDQVEVSNLPFVDIPVVEPEPTPIYKQPWIWNLARQFAGPLLVMLLLIFLLRPVMRNLSTIPAKVRDESSEEALERKQLEHGTVSPEQLDDMTAEERKQYEQELKGESSEPDEEEDLLMLEDEGSYERRLEKLREVVNDNPARAAQVVKGWLNPNE